MQATTSRNLRGQLVLNLTPETDLDKELLTEFKSEQHKNVLHLRMGYICNADKQTPASASLLTYPVK